jgi:hypothetical protein
MWQNVIVALIMIAAIASLVWRYLPARWRRKAGQLHSALAPREGGCGGCGNCGSGGRCPK